MQKSLIIISNSNEIKTLQKKIAKQKKVLLNLSDKIELLTMEIDDIEQQYRVRIGSLQVKDNMLEIEIIRARKILELMEVGLTREEATEEVLQNLKNENKYEEDINFTEGSIPSFLFDNNKDEDVSIKKLWKKLLHAFHPDLTQDKAEKKRRNEIVKKINTAYRLGDFNTLRNVEEKEYLTLEKNESLSSISKLQETLISIENAIIHQVSQLDKLKKTEWYKWVIISNKKRESLFLNLESKLQFQVNNKEKLLHTLKNKNPISRFSYAFRNEDSK